MVIRPSEIVDRLCGRYLTRVEFKKGRPLQGPWFLVDYADSNTLAAAWIEVTEDGLIFHFNARDQYGEMRGRSEPLANTSVVSVHRSER